MHLFLRHLRYRIAMLHHEIDCGGIDDALLLVYISRAMQQFSDLRIRLSFRHLLRCTSDL